jgi:hypothetical protein
LGHKPQAEQAVGKPGKLGLADHWYEGIRFSSYNKKCTFIANFAISGGFHWELVSLDTGVGHS